MIPSADGTRMIEREPTGSHTIKITRRKDHDFNRSAKDGFQGLEYLV
jgi:hypothetical protein